MRILIKYILFTVWRKPMRLMLILLTICLSGAALLASVSLSDTMIKTTTRQWRSEYGYADIAIKPSLSSPSRYLNQFKADRYQDGFSYVVRKLSANASVQGDELTVHGYTLDTLQLLLDLPFAEQLNLLPFEGNKMIVSEKYADENGVSVGDALTVVIEDNRHQFVVVGICPQIGPFAYEQPTCVAIVPYEKMQACLGQLGKADALYIGLKNQKTKSHMILRLSELYKGYSVSETYSVDHIRLQTNRSAVPFVFMSVLLCLMSVYVIYVIFQNIVIERMPQMGIFRAIGVGRLAANGVVLLEGVAYGTIGSTLSLGAGIFTLGWLARHLYAAQPSAAIALSVSPWHIVLTMLVSVGISLVGGVLSLYRYKRLSIVELIKQATGKEAGTRVVLPASACTVFLAAIAVLILWRSQNGLVVYVLLVAMIVLSFLMASPFLYRQFALLIKRIAIRAGGLIKLVSLSIQNQRGFVIAATILSVITSTNIIIGTIAYSDEQGSREYFGRFHYDIELNANDLTRGKVNFLEQLSGVSAACANYYSGSTDVKGQSISIYRIHGVDTLKVDDYMDYKLTSTYASPFDALENGKNILITNTLRNIYHVNEDDTIVLKIYGYDGVYREVAYKIIGFFNDEYTKLGRYALISHKNFAEDFKARGYSTVYLVADDLDVALDSIKISYRDQQFQMTTVQEMQQTARDESQATISAMRWISNLSAITGVLGMLFIMTLSFISRMGELSIYGAMGFEKRSIAKFLFAELLLSGMAGLTAGVIMGAIISFIALPRLIYALQIAMSIHACPAILWSALLSGLGICMASGLVAVVTLQRTPLMGGLKSE